MCSNISWRHLHFWYFLFQALPDTFGIVAQQWSHIETLLNIALDHGENRGQSGRKWTFNFKTAFVDCVVRLFRTPAFAAWRRVNGPIMSSSSSCRPANIVAERQRGSTHIHIQYHVINICIYMCVYISVVFILYASQYKSCEHTYICTHCHIHIIDLQRNNHVIIHDMQRPGISNCWLNIVLKEARVSRFRFQIVSFGGSDSHFTPLLIEILHQFMFFF